MRAVAHLALAALALGVMACVPACATSDTKAVSGRQLRVHEAPAAPGAPKPPAPPQGFVTMTVLGVVPVGDAHAVFLVDDRHQVILPIVVGEGAALAIELRLHHKRFDRPLTHDLLEV